MVSSISVYKTGSKDVPLKTTGHEKVRVSVCLAAKVMVPSLNHLYYLREQFASQKGCMENIVQICIEYKWLDE